MMEHKNWKEGRGEPHHTPQSGFGFGHGNPLGIHCMLLNISIVLLQTWLLDLILWTQLLASNLWTPKLPTQAKRRLLKKSTSSCFLTEELNRYH